MKFLVIQHLVVESFGLFNALCQQAGIAVDVVQVEKGDPFPEVAGYDALWVMGGAMNVDQEAQYSWMAVEKALIRRAVLELGLPYVGICLGAQLLADALGGEVGPMAIAEVGVLPITLNAAGQQHPLLRGLSATLPVVQWHGYGIKHLPEGGQVLASSQACPVQIFAVGDRAFGLQFHPEVDGAVMGSWLAVPDHCAELQSHHGPTACADFQQAVDNHLFAFTTTAQTLFENILSLVSRSHSSGSGAGVQGS